MENKNIMDDVVTTQVSEKDEVALASQYVGAQNINPNKFVRPRRTRTLIREYNKKIGRNDPCPCGALDENGKPKKYKNCCLKTGKYENYHELSASEMSKIRYRDNKPSDFKLEVI